MSSTRAQVVDCSSDELFARSRFSENKDSCVRRRYVLYLFQYALQAGTLADDFVKLMRGDELFFEIAVFLFATPQGFFGFSFLCKVTDYAQNHLPL